ncbi:unnamed protein product [Linum trigynum]|uniref:Uncharacterized protein n=1 Tax=Linum trigynum TaxID=586398 RepID=A0AAV2FU78_9ROSI
MTRSKSGGLLSLDPELERTCRQLRRQQRARLATEERIDGHLSSDSEDEYETDGERNPPQGIPLQVPPVNQILGNNPIPLPLSERLFPFSTLASTAAGSHLGVLLYSMDR